MVVLRKRKPYTCRFEVAYSPCGAYLNDEDTDYCKPHQAAVERFSKPPVKKQEKGMEYDRRRIWP